ncbi:hypothetical protein Clocl_3168 [Acetivibrio clariflavus DSM 19732]|uniref:Uncharacterized protein n=1 Tax=Acetivibrio clariflavus (strain DSM 19732 / NBRC 101661 / EBR45) TaxID=720554 RepID=G8LVQ4_ACECE|nr:hypothetical protein Clocl_3168 [Acetivibrio clariflavus DSM 19732]
MFGMENRYYKISLGDLFKALFCKKICPNCGAKLKRVRINNFSHKGKYSIAGNVYYGNIYNVKFHYHCENCCKDFEVDSLWNKK